MHNMEDIVMLYLNDLIKNESKIKKIIYIVDNYRIDSGYRDKTEEKRCKIAFIEAIKFALTNENDLK